MKRFSFFLAVFSVGLLLFLLLTGQFGTLTGGGGPPPEGGGTAATEPIQEPSRGEKRITYHKHDYERGRLEFTLRGAIEGSSEMRISSNPEELGQPRALRDAELEIPLYGAQGAAAGAEDVFLLKAERVQYEPRDGTGPEHVLLEGAIHGEGRSGTPSFDTRDVTLSIRPDESSRLSGSERIEVSYPAVTLRGQKGFEATIAGSEGIGDLRVNGPLVVALSPDEDGSILGFQGDALFADGAGGEERARVHLYSRGPMRIDPAGNAAIFEGPVAIYQVPADTPLDPPADADLPENRFLCERLRLELDSASRRVTRLVASKVTKPVEVHLADGYRVEGNELVWSDGEQEALLDGDVRIVGDIGEFGAGRARLHPGEGLCWLVGGITARVRGEAFAGDGTASGSESGAGEGEWSRRLGGVWLLEGDRAELRYSRSPEGQELDLFRALAAPGERVTIREDRTGGALLLGAEMVYDPALGAIRVLPGDAPGAMRPEFHDGRSRGSADRIDLALVRPELTFEGGVDVLLVDPPSDADGSLPKWLSPSPDASTRVVAERVRLSWDDANRLQGIDAWRGEKPVELDHRSAEPFHLVADSIAWSGVEGTIRASGEGRQHLVFAERAEILARELSFSVITWIARGDGEVRCIAHQPAPAQAEGPARRPVTIDGDHVEVALRPPPAEGDGEAAPQPATAPPPAAPSPLRSGEVLGARGWSDTPGTLAIEEASFRAIGDQLDWDSVKGVVRLHGAGRQRVFHLGPEGPDELTADAITYSADERKLVLEGETRAKIHQGSVAPSDGEKKEESKSGSLLWDLTAGSLEAFFRPVEGGEEGAVTLDRVVAGGGVVLTQEESEIEFRGDCAEWDVATERLRVFSAKDQGLQTLYRGRERRDEIVAREILLVRPRSTGSKSSERIEVLFIDVLNAEFHIEEGAADDAKRPDSFSLRTDNLLLGLSGTKERVSENVSPIPIDEARAWGNVDFRGGDYRIYSHRAIFKRNVRTLTFQGQERQKVQILLGGQATIPASNEMELEYRPGKGYILNERPATGRWSARSIEETLERFDRKDRKETPEAPR